MGPEIIAGSTRLKAGTATKMILNTISTGAMVRIGKTLGNRMGRPYTVEREAADSAAGEFSENWQGSMTHLQARSYHGVTAN